MELARERPKPALLRLKAVNPRLKAVTTSLIVATSKTPDARY
jgi:hypothetical protein